MSYDTARSFVSAAGQHAMISSLVTTWPKNWSMLNSVASCWRLRVGGRAVAGEHDVVVAHERLPRRGLDAHVGGDAGHDDAADAAFERSTRSRSVLSKAP